MNFYFDKTTTKNIDIHKFIFELHVGVLEYFSDLPKFTGDWKTYYLENILDKVYYLEFKSN